MCIVVDSEKVLLEHEKYYELYILYERKGLHRKGFFFLFQLFFEPSQQSSGKRGTKHPIIETAIDDISYLLFLGGQCCSKCLTIVGREKEISFFSLATSRRLEKETCHYLVGF